jgi:transcriptional regulator
MATNSERQVQVRRHNPVEHSERVIDNLQDRGHALDADAATQQQRRLTAIGDWRTRKRS